MTEVLDSRGEGGIGRPNASTTGVPVIDLVLQTGAVAIHIKGTYQVAANVPAQDSAQSADA